MEWIYQDNEFVTAPEEYQGFVYEVTELDTGKKYIGKKFFWKTRKLPITKTRKRRVVVREESDWKTYFGSSQSLCQLVEAKGRDAFKREILRLCKTKGECSYYEAKAQFDNDVLLSDEYFNEFIGCKIHSRHIKK
jgi:hypothetical protein|tara:strand:- start:247 stop:651 length:405 start_codon:yes stop_codon:yes gene_type:complete